MIEIHNKNVKKWCTQLNDDTIFFWEAETTDGKSVSCSWKDNQDYSLLFFGDYDGEQEKMIVNIDIGVWFVLLAAHHTLEELQKPFDDHQQYFLGRKIVRQKP